MTYLPTPPSESTPSISAKEATVYLHTPFHPKAEEYAKTKFGKILRPEDASSVEEIMGQVDGILLRVSNITRDMLRAAPKLRIISRNGVGVDNIHMPTARERGVVVTNCPGGNAQAVAELALTLALTVLRRVVEIDNRIRSGEKVPSITALAPGLFGKTVGLIGMGDIAYEFAKLLLSFNCKIIVYSPTSPSTRWTTADPKHPHKYPVEIPHTRAATLPELLAAADVVSIHCPLNDSTRGLIGKDELEMMKQTAVILNTARGGIIDERQLEDALEQGVIAGAGIDVWEVEPAFGETMGKLGKLRNTVVLPHL
nr:phosphoglycerate dehydrogenase [Kwoniella dejecticola CBS 10117]OBR81446.1 phosphoglycerate dehydrogenase [Kwoniella dejecticola CBS 10117]